MSNSHGELFTEIGKLVLAANSGQEIDLHTTARDLAKRYENLGMTEETMMKVVSRSIGAISFSMARSNGGLRLSLEALRESQTGTKPVREAPAPVTAREAKPAAPAIAAPAPAKVATPAQAPANAARRSAARPKAKASAGATGAESAGGQSKSLFPSGVRLAVLS